MLLTSGKQLWLRCCSLPSGSIYSPLSLTLRFYTIDVDHTLPPVVFEHQPVEYAGVVVGRFASKYNRNAFSRVMMKTLNDELDKLYMDRKARVLILKSDIPGVFCAGADLKERRAMPNEEVPHFVAGLRALMTKLADVPIPVIAAIDGVAFGGGLEMALACDIRIATPTSMMGLVETRLGIIPGAGGTQRLTRAVGVAKAKELIFRGVRITGEEAARIGLINHVDDDSFGLALEMARDILKAAPIAVRVAKKVVDHGAQVDIHSGLAYEGHGYAQVVWTKDRQEGMEAFVDKREPVFIGE